MIAVPRGVVSPPGIMVTRGSTWRPFTNMFLKSRLMLRSTRLRSRRFSFLVRGTVRLMLITRLLSRWRSGTKLFPLVRILLLVFAGASNITRRTKGSKTVPLLVKLRVVSCPLRWIRLLVVVRLVTRLTPLMIRTFLRGILFSKKG